MKIHICLACLHKYANTTRKSVLYHFRRQALVFEFTYNFRKYGMKYVQQQKKGTNPFVSIYFSLILNL